MTRSNLLACLAALASLSACGPGAVEPFEPTLPADRTLGSLTDEEAAGYCDEADAFRAEHLSDAEVQRMFCTLFAASFSADAASCERSVTACLASPPTTTLNCLAESPERAGCMVPLSDMNACLTASIGATVEAAPDLTCALAGDPMALSRFSGLMPAACTSITDRCPELDTAE